MMSVSADAPPVLAPLLSPMTLATALTDPTRTWCCSTWPLGSMVTQGCHVAVAAVWAHRDHPYTLTYYSDANIDSMHKIQLKLKKSITTNNAIGAVVFCWGGELLSAKVVIELARADEIQAGVLLHLSFVILDDIRDVKSHPTILGLETDHPSPPAMVKQFEEVLSLNSQNMRKRSIKREHAKEEQLEYEEDSQRLSSVNEQYQLGKQLPDRMATPMWEDYVNRHDH